MRRLTADDLINDVRSVIDEDNTANVDDERDILPALNRAMDYASNILARHYDAPMITSVSVSTTDNVADYAIPQDAFEQRIEKVEVAVNGIYFEVKRISYRDATDYETPARVSIPNWYAVIGTDYRLYPTPTGTYPLRVWYMKNPLPLVKSQGRVTIVNTTSNYIIVDSVGSDLTTEMDNLNSYVNIIDGETGNLKTSLQIQSIVGERITFKSSPNRTSVLGVDIEDSLLDADSNPIVEADDLICVVSGSCVPIFKKPFSNFLIQYAVAEITRKLGGSADMEEKVKAELEKQVEHSWVGREQSLRVKKVTNQWNQPVRRWWGRG